MYVIVVEENQTGLNILGEIAAICLLNKNLAFFVVWLLNLFCTFVSELKAEPLCFSTDLVSSVALLFSIR